MASVVEFVGTMPSGSASPCDEASRTMSLERPMGESALPMSAMIVDLNFLRIGISLTHSTVAPLLEIRIVGSPGSYTPRSPCTASQAWRNTAGVPVLESVAAIFWATSPDLPTPQTSRLCPWCERDFAHGAREICVEPVDRCEY